MRTYRFPACVVMVDDDEQWAMTRFLDGTEVHARPEHDEVANVKACAFGYGYGQTWAMSRDHELAHAWLAGRGVSPTMWALAHGRPQHIDGEEEAMVAALQRALDKSTARPWDEMETSHE